MRKIEILNGYGYIDDSGTVTTKRGKQRKTLIIGKQVYVQINRIMYKVSDLMLGAFFPDVDANAMQIYFKDGNNENLALSNLKVGHKWRGIKNTREKALAIKTLYESGFSYPELVITFELPKSTIRNYINKDY
ncbi:hypothetical protein ABEL47_01675 [Escherichia coli]